MSCSAISGKTLSAMPIGVIQLVISFNPDSSRVLRAVSREWNCFVGDYAQWKAEEILSLSADRIKRLHPWLVACDQFVPDRFQYHSTLTRTIGEFFHQSEQRGRFRQIWDVREIERLEGRIEHLEDHDLKTVWGQVHQELHEAAELPDAAPGPEAPVDEIRHWMHAEEHRDVLVRVQSLELSESQLHSVPPEIASLVGLRNKLDLSDNRLIWIPEDRFQRLIHLQHLDLSENALSGHLSENLFRNLFSLRTLNLSDNCLTRLPATLFCGLTSLELLDLVSNSLTSLHENLFQGLNNLVEVHLNYNDLVSLPEKLFRDNTGLQVLSLAQNCLSSLPANLLKGLSQLQVLRLDHNRLLSLPPTFFHGCTGVGSFFIRENPLLFFLKNEMRYEGFAFFSRVMHGFYHYRCISPLAKFYQSVTHSTSMEGVRKAFAGLEEPLRRILPAKVIVAAGLPTGDSQWDQDYVSDDMHHFAGVMKNYVVETLNLWTPVAMLRIREIAAQVARDVSQSHTQPGANLFEHNILIWIDAKELYVESHIELLNYHCKSPLASLYALVVSDDCSGDARKADARILFDQLPSAIQEGILKTVQKEAGASNHGESAALENMQIFGRALQRYVKENLHCLPQETKQVIKQDITQSAQVGTGVAAWDRHLACNNLLRCIDVMMSMHLLGQQPQGKKRAREDVSG